MSTDAKTTTGVMMGATPVDKWRKPTDEELANRYSYHAPTPTQTAIYGAVRAYCLQLAKYIRDVTPCCRDQSLAFTALDEVMFRANAAVARNSGGAEPTPVEGMVGAQPTSTTGPGGGDNAAPAASVARAAERGYIS